MKHFLGLKNAQKYGLSESGVIGKEFLMRTFRAILSIFLVDNVDNSEGIPAIGTSKIVQSNVSTLLNKIVECNVAN